MSQLAFDLATIKGHSDIFRTNGDGRFARNFAGVGEGYLAAFEEDAVTLSFALHKVNQTDEVCNHLIGRLGVDFVGSADLLHNAHAHYNHTVTHSHGFALIMGYINNGDAGFLLDFQNLKAHGFTQLSIQIGQGLVQKQQAGRSHQSASQGYTLLLTTGQLVGITLAIFTQVYQLQHFLHTTFTLSLIHLFYFQGIAHVFSHSHMRP